MRLTLLLLTLAAALPQAPARPIALSFHHLHLRDRPPAFWIGFYERLFDPAQTLRVTFAGVPGLQTGSRRILVSPPEQTSEVPAALWHFGWGRASLGESYLAHARREVAWEPPLPPEDLHIHLRSIAPAAAAVWYRDALDAAVDVAPPARVPSPLPRPEDRMPEALVHVGGLPLLVYRTDGPLLPSLGQRIDHLAFSCDDLHAVLEQLMARGVRVLRGPEENGGVRTAMIAGPDQIAIELVELDR